jgi:hypothetical protein
VEQPQRAGLLPGAQIAERPGGLTSIRPGPRCARPRARAPGARALPQPVFAGPARAALYVRAPLVILTAPACSLGRRARTDARQPLRPTGSALVHTRTHRVRLLEMLFSCLGFSSGQ